MSERLTSPGELVLARAATRIVEAWRANPPTDDVRRARLCVLHHLACAERGRDLPWSRAALAVAGTGSVSDQAFVGAVRGQSTLAEDLHTPSLTHPGSVVVPVALAVARERGASTEVMLSAVLAGYDVLCRLGTALKTSEFIARGFRPSAVFGPFGAAAAAAALLELDEDQAGAALAIAANSAAGLREWAHSGSTDVYLHNGFAARNGHLAASLAAAGVTGPRGVLDGAAGMGVAYAGGGVDWSAAVVAFNQGSVVHEVEFKRYPACSAVQAVLVAAERIRDQHDGDPAAIARVVVHTHRHGKQNPGCDSVGPWAELGQAQMSNQLGVALALTGGRLDIEDYRRFGEPRILDLARRVEVVEDPGFTARYPSVSAARVEVRYHDGSHVEESAQAAPLTAAEVERRAALVPIGSKLPRSTGWT